jgi:hypothetical protein
VVPLRQDGRETAEVRLNGKLVFAVAAGEESLSPRERARRIAARLSAMFSDSLGFNDVRVSEERGALLLKGIPVIQVFPEDAQAAGSTKKALDRAYQEIMRALVSEQLNKQS